jgi:hypothetical protein
MYKTHTRNTYYKCAAAGATVSIETPVKVWPQLMNICMARGFNFLIILALQPCSAPHLHSFTYPATGALHGKHRVVAQGCVE